VTHTNHRQGTVESLQRDYVVFIYPARGINDQDAGPKVERFLQMAFEHGMINAGPARTGDRFLVDPERVVNRPRGSGSAYAVFNDKEKVTALVRDLVREDMGISIVVSGLFDEVDDVCERVGIRRHTAQCSLGISGQIDRLPPDAILDIATMCGHGMVSFNLVRRMAREVARGQTSLEEAGRILARPCSCGIFNPERARELLQHMLTEGIPQ